MFDAESSRYILLQIVPRSTTVVPDCCKQYYYLQNQNIPVIVVHVANCLAGLYVDMRDIHYTDRNISRLVGSLLVGNYNIDLTKTTQPDYYQMCIDSIKNKNREKEMNFEEISKKPIKIEKLENQKITQYHHLHLRVNEIAEANDDTIIKGHLRCSNPYINAILNKLTGWTNIHSTVSTFYLYCSLAPQWAVEYLFYLFTEAQDYKDLSALLKVEGILAKQAQGLVRNDLNIIFELQVLVNRLETEVDWNEEEKDRVQPKLPQIDETQLFNDAVTMFEQAKTEGKSPIRMSWEKYWNLRWGLAPAGSVHSPDPKAMDIIKTIPRRGRNKKSYLSMVKDMTHSQLMEALPRIVARTSIKYEWGKTRALYGCDINSHLNADFGMMNCEDTLPSFMPTGSQANETNIKNLMIRMKKGIPFCYDYDNFNSQHSKTSMKLVIKAWLRVFGANLDESQVRSTLWTMESIDRMFVENSINSRNYEANGTLFSGWRLTSFINTCLNFLYLKQADIISKSIYSLHNGDDVFAICNNMYDAILIARKAKTIGVRAQLTKMNIGTISEFLRMDCNTTNPTGAQYLTRACATAVHSRIESGAPTSAVSALQAESTRLIELVQRGADINIVKKLVAIRTSFLAKQFETDPECFRLYNTLHPVAGGSDKDAKVTGVRLVPKLIKSTDTELQAVSDKMAPGMRDYARQVAKQLGVDESVIKYKNLQRINEANFSVRHETIRIDTEDVSKQRIKRGLYKSWANSRLAGHFNQMRMIGMSAVMSNNKQAQLLTSMITDKSQMIDMLRVML